MNVLIADDEQIVLEGLKYIIDWNALGFTICATAVNGEEALEKILALKPDLCLMDIKMPKKNGIEVVQAAVDQGYGGKFIILSGLSDFKMAQTAMRYGVDFYLTKPIDEEELEKSVRTVRELIEKEARATTSYSQYREKARDRILEDILLNQCDYRQLDLEELHLKANIYQVISYENYNQQYFYQTWNFAELMRVANQDNTTFDALELDGQRIILLKGDFAISKFENLLRHYKAGPQKGSPFDSIFLAYGQRVSRVEDIHLSYEDGVRLCARRFFCQENQHIVGFQELEDLPSDGQSQELPTAREYGARLSGYIQSRNMTLITETLKDLRDRLTASQKDILSIKHFLVDIYINIKQRLLQVYPNTELPVMANTSAIQLVEGKYYLYEIIAFLAEQADLLAHSVGYTSGQGVMDEVLHYIRHNYQENLKLETLAPLFGYNSSYLGKIFSRKMGVNFNSYVDQVRIEQSKRLLEDESLKVYEIAERIGYKNVDYFHKKFKKYTGTSPVEYRKQLFGEHG